MDYICEECGQTSISSGSCPECGGKLVSIEDTEMVGLDKVDAFGEHDEEDPLIDTEEDMFEEGDIEDLDDDEL